MFKIFNKALLLTLFPIVFVLVPNQQIIAQGIVHYSEANTEYNDLVIINNQIHVVGKKIINNKTRPVYLKLDGNGNVLNDTVLSNLEGYFSNIFFLNNNFHLSSSLIIQSSYESIDIVIDTNFNFKYIVDIEDGQIDKSVLSNDSIILHIGHNNFSNNLNYSFVAVENLNDTSVNSNFTYFSSNPIEMYDIFSLRGKYFYFMNSPDSTTKSHVLQYILDSNLTVIDSFNLYSSYKNFNSNNSVLGPACALVLNDSNFMLSSTISHKVYQNEIESLDHGISIYNLGGQEKSISFAGNPDTNSLTSNSSLVNNGSDIFSIATENITGVNNSNSYVKLTKIDFQGKIEWSSEFMTNSNLIVNNLYSLGLDSLIILGESYSGTNKNSFILKTDTTPEGLMNSLLSLEFKPNDLKVYPNPFTNTLNLESKSKKIDIVILYNNYGQKVREYYNTTSLTNIENLPTGLYIIHLISASVKRSFKIIKTDD